MRELWVEKYRPKTLGDYVFRDEKQKRTCHNWVNDGAIPNLMLSGGPGVGKTTLALILLRELKAQRGDVMRLNASQENSVDTVRDKMIGFVSTIPLGDYKYILLDEADYLSHSAQAVLRGVSEQFSHTARFILTLNYPNRIIGALHSRFQGFHIEKPEMTAFIERIVTILDAEKIEIDPDALDTYVRTGYPDLRKTIQMLQQNSQGGQLLRPAKSDAKVEQDYQVKMVELFKAGKINEARKLITSTARPDEYEDIYRWLYNNLDLWGETDDQQNEAILRIRDGLVKHSMVADVEINLSATLVELAQLRNQ